jgi:hypothetical protein
MQIKRFKNLRKENATIRKVLETDKKEKIVTP